MTQQSRKHLLAALSKVVTSIIKDFKSFSTYTFKIDSVRTAKDVLEHIVFWHESFSRNTRDVAQKKQPKPLKGSYAKLAEQSQKEMSHESVANLLLRLTKAQESIEKNILNTQIVSIPYRVGSRAYTPEEHLDVVQQHLLGHLNEVKKSYSSLAAEKKQLLTQHTFPLNLRNQSEVSSSHSIVF